MNLRALTRGDAAVAGAAVLLFISSFLPYVAFEYCITSKACSSSSQSAWSTALFPVLPSVYLLGLIAAALILLQRFQGEAVAGRLVLGLRLDQWGVALAVAALWSGLWALAGGGSATGYGHSYGAYLGVLALLVLAGAAAAGPLVPALQAPLLTDKPPVTQAPYAGAPVGGFQPAPGQPGQYGYPADQGLGQAQPGQGGLPGYATPPEQQQHGYGYPTPGQAVGQPAPAHQEPTQVQPAVAMPAPAAPAADFAPFWFAVPAPRQLAPRDNPVGPPVGELVPGTWYLAVEQRGNSLVAQLQDGSHGLLNDASGIQRG
ncbi:MULTISPECIES: hypothetical protein [unclassified Kitasatospora]|uniref:hypothetical protein n=1 Tax=unclassified Kitasatospora TaxID=2633591 RepID=UPI00070FA031|nr:MULTISPECIES: hypothetical protein [unclassified Kitasatospora]KQV05695.1 hypothetical protein ASC99_12980 [Kitasatospora sp. Root107]KRB62499.1 hypothetical protein ASE03_07940 [Kitasatospora sp. Root187]